MRIMYQWIRRQAPVLLLAAGASLLWTAGLSKEGLWYDELQSVTYAVLPLKQLLTSVQVGDPHPPAYYLQLHYWLMGGTSDCWVRLNSIVFTLASLVLICGYVMSIKGRELAIGTAAVFACAPIVDFYAREARMYAMQMMLAVVALVALRRAVAHGFRWIDSIPFIVVIEVLLYTQGAAFIILPGLVLYNLLSYERAPALATASKNCLAWIVVLAGFIPWGWSALGRGGTAHLGVASAASSMQALSALIIGTSPQWTPTIQAFAIAATAGLLLTGALASREVMRLMTCLVVMPIGIAIAVSLVVRPIWDVRTIAWTFPFAAVGIAAGAARASETPFARLGMALRWPGTATASFLLLTCLFVQRTTHSWPWDIRGASQFLERVNPPGGMTVLVPSSRVLWGFAWYLVGPGSVNPLDPAPSLVAGDGIYLVTAPAPDEIGLRPPYWIAYRAGEENVPLPWIVLRESNIDFSGLHLDYVPPQPP